MSDGFCIYNGTVANMVPFCCNIGLKCPENYSPADYSKNLYHSCYVVLLSKINSFIKPFKINHVIHNNYLLPFHLPVNYFHEIYRSNDGKVITIFLSNRTGTLRCKNNADISTSH